MYNAIQHHPFPSGKKVHVPNAANEQNQPTTCSDAPNNVCVLMCPDQYVQIPRKITTRKPCEKQRRAPSVFSLQLNMMPKPGLALPERQ